ncbi:MAG: 3-dehydroquinate synthase [Bacteroidetes bacterium]|nr:3-dehydroquinate synthase [Bacteroidota bacterium]
MNDQPPTYGQPVPAPCLYELTQEEMQQLAPPERSIVLMDEHVFQHFPTKWSGYRILLVPPGEQNKTFCTLELLSEQLLALGANRQSLLVAVGGGVVTDLVGYLAASFMRGVACAFVPTTVLAQVDAALGGKNGINVGLHKNMLGTIRQPEFIAINREYLATLPDLEWANGFAEIIKYGWIDDVAILEILESSNLPYFQKNLSEFSLLSARCTSIKNRIVAADEFENGERKKLNFGHTVGHALETLYRLPHGHAVSLGMRAALRLSEIHEGLDPSADRRLAIMLQQYQLPTSLELDELQVLDLLMHDKKRNGTNIDFILLERAGKAVIRQLSREEIRMGLSTIQAT